MHNIRAHPFLFFIHLLYTNTLLDSKPYKPTLLPLFRSFKPTLSKALVAHYGMQFEVKKYNNNNNNNVDLYGAQIHLRQGTQGALQTKLKLQQSLQK